MVPSSHGTEHSDYRQKAYEGKRATEKYLPDSAAAWTVSLKVSFLPVHDGPKVAIGPADELVGPVAGGRYCEQDWLTVDKCQQVD